MSKRRICREQESRSVPAHCVYAATLLKEDAAAAKNNCGVENHFRSLALGRVLRTWRARKVTVSGEEEER